MALKEVQTALDRVQSLEHVAGYVCMTSTGRSSSSSSSDRRVCCSGVAVRSTFTEEYTRTLVTQLQPFLERLKRTITRLGLKDVRELRLTTEKFVYLLRTDHVCSFIVVQRHERSSNGTDE
jgi:hypothetical protein